MVFHYTYMHNNIIKMLLCDKYYLHAVNTYTCAHTCMHTIPIYVFEFMLDA